MQTTRIIVFIAALSLVAAALAGVAFAQLTTPNTPSTPYSSQTTEPWCISGNPQATAPYCFSNSATNGLNSQGCNGYSVQGTGQFSGMMGGRNAMGGWGMNGRGW